MIKIDAADARKDFSELTCRVAYKGERVVLRRNGKDFVALVPLQDLDLLARLEEQIDLDEARKALTETARKGSKPWTRLKKELGL